MMFYKFLLESNSVEIVRSVKFVLKFGEDVSGKVFILKDLRRVFLLFFGFILIRFILIIQILNYNMKINENNKKIYIIIYNHVG